MFGTVRPPITMMRWSGRSCDVEYHRSTWVLSAVSTQSHEPVGVQGVNVLNNCSQILFILLHRNAKTLEESKGMLLIHSEILSATATQEKLRRKFITKTSRNCFHRSYREGIMCSTFESP